MDERYNFRDPGDLDRFALDRVFTPEEFKERIVTALPGEVIVWDEARAE